MQKAAVDGVQRQDMWPQAQDGVETTSPFLPNQSMFPQPPTQEEVVEDLFDHHIRQQDLSKKKSGHLVIKAKHVPSPLTGGQSLPQGPKCAYWNFLDSDKAFQPDGKSTKKEGQPERNGRPYHFYYVEEEQGSQLEQSDAN